MSDDTRVDVCGRICNTGTPDADGIDWRVFGPDLAGWSGAPISLDLDEPTGQDRSVEISRSSPARTVIVPGRIKAPTQALAFAAYQVLSNKMPGRRREGELIVHEPIPKRLRVRQHGVPRLTYPRRARVNFELTLLALDPFKTALEPTVAALPAGGTVSLTNDGDEAAYVSIESTSAGTVWVRQDVSGAVMRSRDAVAPGVVFDAVSRTIGGGLAFPMVSPSQWLVVPAESTVGFTSLGSADADLTIFDTYS